jgi:hypothetical protein
MNKLAVVVGSCPRLGPLQANDSAAMVREHAPLSLLLVLRLNGTALSTWAVEPAPAGQHLLLSEQESDAG